MSSTGLDIFDTTLEKTNHLLKKIEEDLGWENRRNQSYSALRATLHALRDRLTIEDAVHLSAQLPLLVKGIYFDGWDPMTVPIKMNKNEFITYINQNFRFDTKMGIEDVIKTVLFNVFDMIDPEEVSKIVNSLPKDIATIFC